MSEYEPGTVAVATVRGVEGVRVMRCGDGDGRRGFWWSPMYQGDASGSEPQWRMHDDRYVTNIRPLVVLDVADFLGRMVSAPTVDELPAWLRTLADANSNGKDTLGSQAARLLADQIEAQTKPPRIPEPGLWGVVEARVPGIPTRRWVHHEEGRWVPDMGIPFKDWEDLIDPTLVRDGVSA